MCVSAQGTGQNPPPDKTPLRTKPPSSQNPPPAKTPLWPKPPSGQNPPLAKTPLWPKTPSGKKPPPAKKTLRQKNPFGKKTPSAKEPILYNLKMYLIESSLSSLIFKIKKIMSKKITSSTLKVRIRNAYLMCRAG